MGLFRKKEEKSKVKWPDDEEWKIIHNRFDNNKEACNISRKLIWTDYYGDIDILENSYRERQIGIKIYSDHILTKRGIIKYSEYKFEKLENLESIRQFAFWLADFLPQGTIFHIHTLYKNVGSADTPYYYVTPSNNVALGGLSYYGSDVKAGYQIYVTDNQYAPRNDENYKKMKSACENNESIKSIISEVLKEIKNCDKDCRLEFYTHGVKIFGHGWDSYSRNYEITFSEKNLTDLTMDDCYNFFYYMYYRILEDGYELNWNSISVPNKDVSSESKSIPTSFKQTSNGNYVAWNSDDYSGDYELKKIGYKIEVIHQQEKPKERKQEWY